MCRVAPDDVVVLLTVRLTVPFSFVLRWVILVDGMLCLVFLRSWWQSKAVFLLAFRTRRDRFAHFLVAASKSAGS